MDSKTESYVGIFNWKLDLTDGPESYPNILDLASDEIPSRRRGSKEIWLPPVSITQHCGSSPPIPGPRSRARLSEKVDEFDCSASTTSRRRGRPRNKAGRLSAWQRPLFRDIGPRLPKPNTRKISYEQLAAEVQGIYSGIFLLEEKCIEYHRQCPSIELSEEQYRALVLLHRSLLHEHHDFFLASSHPSAKEALLTVASEYYMPARLWRHGIHSFLELLRSKLPHSLEHMLTFIYIAYTLMALLYETAPAFKDIWIECLGDLARYRMAIEDDDIRTREIWTGVSRNWYTKASDNAPTTGRLYHHLAILARPNALQQLHFYAKSLCVTIPFPKTRDNIMTLFDPLFNSASNTGQRLEPVDAAFARVHGILFSGKYEDQLEASMEEFLGLLDGRIGREHGNWLESGYHISISLSCLLLGFGNESNVLMQVIINENKKSSVAMIDDSDAEIEPSAAFKTAVSFTARTYNIVVTSYDNNDILPCLHILLVFYRFMLRFDAGRKHLEDSVPWDRTVVLLNYLLRKCDTSLRLDTEQIPGTEEGEAHPLPEDYAMRGLIYTTDYFPANWFDNAAIGDDEKYFELESNVGKRRERILWLGYQIALAERKLFWDATARQFWSRSNDIGDPQYELVAPPASDSTSHDGLCSDDDGFVLL